MERLAHHLATVERNMRINSADPVALHGFTQLPNFILRNPELSPGAKATYALFLSYAWHNDLCFPGQDKLAASLGRSSRPCRSSKSPGAARGRPTSTPSIS